MPGETLSFDLLVRGEAQASRNIRQLGDAMLSTSGKIDLAAASMAAYDQTTLKSAKAANTAITARKQHAAAEKLLGDAIAVENNQATKHIKLLADEGRRLDELAPRTSRWRSLTNDASAALGDMGTALQGNVTGMGALVAAGVALAPVAITVGAGLGGLGIAAAGIIGPVVKAAEASGGLEKNLAKLDPSQRQAARSLLALRGSYQVFQDELRPTVLADFNAALGAARPLLVGLEPVAQSSGKALESAFSQIGATFRSGEWQQFFTFMAAHAGPDIRQLTGTLQQLLVALPPLVEELHPLGSAILFVTGAAAKLTAGGGLLGVAGIQATALKDAAEGTHDPLAGMAHWMLGVAGGLGLTSKTSGPAAAGMARMGVSAGTASTRVQQLYQQVTKLENAELASLNSQLAYGNALITGKTDALGLAAALKKSHGEIGLHTAAERASFSAANTYIGDLTNTAQQALKSGHGVNAAIAAIRAGLPILDSAKTKNRQYWQELSAVNKYLDLLRQQRAISEHIIVHGDGTFSVGTFRVKGAAAGMMVRGGVPGRDSVLIKAMPGEVVVPTSMVNAGAVDHLRGRIPGFGAGGIVPSYSGSVAGLVPWAGHDIAVKNLQVTQAIGAEFGKIFASAVAAAKASAAAAAAVAGGGGYNAARSAEYAFAKSLFPAHGWGLGQFPPLLSLWNRESGWNPAARNPSSGAAGIPQDITGNFHGGWKGQIIWGENYIKGRYGSPSAAWAHETAVGWYGKGLDAVFSGPTIIGVGERGREHVRVTPLHAGSGGATQVVHITVNVPPTVNPVDAGRQVAEMLKAYVKRGGKLYPNGTAPR